ncbi:MAG TPA: hypothetical protein VFX16_19615 [Pseudonocardiaceae bacterium]|nr:hypothetical protein [Pseudonocardiaceae bacterium]
MMVPRDWFAELMERWRREIAAEPFRHSTELRDAIRRWVERQQQLAATSEPLDPFDPPVPPDE